MNSTIPDARLEAFPQFSRIAHELGAELDSIGFYEGVFREYVDDLNRGVTWDVDLVETHLRDHLQPVNSLIVDLGGGSGRLSRARAPRMERRLDRQLNGPTSSGQSRGRRTEHQAAGSRSLQFNV